MIYDGIYQSPLLMQFYFTSKMQIYNKIVFIITKKYFYERMEAILKKYLKKTKSFITILGFVLLISSFLVSCSRQTVQQNTNTKVSADYNNTTDTPLVEESSKVIPLNTLSKQEEETITSFALSSPSYMVSELIYISEKMAIFYDYFGILIYDLEQEKLIQVISFEEILGKQLSYKERNNLNLIASEDGSEILITYLKQHFLYSISDNKSRKTKSKKLESPYHNLKSASLDLSFPVNIYNFSYTEAIYNDSIYAQLCMKKPDKAPWIASDMRDLTLILYKVKKDKKTVTLLKEYRIFEKVLQDKKLGSFLFSDQKGNNYYLREYTKTSDKKEISFPSDDKRLELVKRTANGEQILDNLIWNSFLTIAPIFLADDHIIYQAAAEESTIGYKMSTLVSIKTDGTDRVVCDYSLYINPQTIHFENGYLYCERNVNTTDKINRPVIRMNTDFSNPIEVATINGKLICVKDNICYFLSDNQEHSGVYTMKLDWKNESYLFDKLGFTSEKSNFLCRHTNDNTIVWIIHNEESDSQFALLLDYWN